MNESMLKKSVAEMIGTFMIVFFGCGAVATNQISDGAVGLPGIAFAFGLAVATAIYAFGAISGAHINPAVSVALAATGKMSFAECVKYVFAQLLGATLAAATLFCLLDSLVDGDAALSLGVTTPVNGSWLTAGVLEFILTFVLMAVILGSTGKGSTPGFAGFAIGAIVCAEILTAGPICGASMNPARSFGPALVSLVSSGLVAKDVLLFSAYVAGPLAGATTATWLFDWLAAEKEGE